MLRDPQGCQFMNRHGFGELNLSKAKDTGSALAPKCTYPDCIVKVGVRQDKNVAMRFGHGASRRQ